MTQQICYDILLVMNKDLAEYAQKAFKIGQISGKSFVVKHYLKRALEEWELDEIDAKGYVKDALKGIEEIAKLSREI